MRRTRRFGVNVLGRQQELFVARATHAAPSDSPASTGNPDAPAYRCSRTRSASLECEIVAEHPTGDHWIVVGPVDNLRISPTKDPLVSSRACFARCTSEVRPRCGRANTVPFH
jgi:flavin reductase (DIM6/NTAB) family NADH-FMN oxidoreductase RutF